MTKPNIIINGRPPIIHAHLAIHSESHVSSIADSDIQQPAPNETSPYKPNCNPIIAVIVGHSNVMACRNGSILLANYVSLTLNRTTNT